MSLSSEGRTSFLSISGAFGTEDFCGADAPLEVGSELQIAKVTPPKRTVITALKVKKGLKGLRARCL